MSANLAPDNPPEVIRKRGLDSSPPINSRSGKQAKTNCTALEKNHNVSQIRTKSKSVESSRKIDNSKTSLETGSDIMSATADPKIADAGGGAQSVIISKDISVSNQFEHLNPGYSGSQNKQAEVKTTMVDDAERESGLAGTGTGGEGGVVAAAVGRGYTVDSEGFQRRRTGVGVYAEKAVRKAEGIVARMRGAHGAVKPAKFSNGQLGQFSLTFCVKGSEENKEDGGITQELFLDIYSHVRNSCKGATPRMTITKKLEVWCNTLEDLETIKQWKVIGNVELVKIESASVALWGRIENVHTQLTDDFLLKFLKDQGVSKVRRVHYTVTLINSDGKRIPEKRCSHKVDLLFENTIRPVVQIAGDEYNVMLKAPSPLQCLNCLEFNHKRDRCTAGVVCLNCAQTGHTSETCRNSSRCVNCHLNHHALSASCPVYRVWAGFERSKYESRVVEHTKAEVKCEEVKVLRRDGTSYVAAVNRTLVAVSNNQSQPVCTLPKFMKPHEAVKQVNESRDEVKQRTAEAKQTVVPVQQTRPTWFPPTAVEVELQQERALRVKDMRKMRQMRAAMTTLWESITAMLTTFAEKFPELQQILGVIQGMKQVMEINADSDDDEMEMEDANSSL